MTSSDLELDLLRPAAPEDWDLDRAGHLLRRAGFGGPPDEVQALHDMGLAKAVDALLDFPERDAELDAELRQQGGELFEISEGRLDGSPYEALDHLRRWWLYRMVRTRTPLREKLALLWHDHFACQATVVVRAPIVLQQNELFRSHAAAPFGDLVRAVARDAAMLVFLDGRVNSAASPNENWARELLELFTLGVDRYTQADVVELARVFTGWSTPADHSTEFVFVPEMHDDGDKLLFGRSLRGRGGMAGIEEGEEALARILARPECAELLARTLLGWFADHEVDAAVAVELAEVLRARDLSVREGLRVLFRSEWFLARERHFARFSSPVEWAAGAARALGVQNVHLAGLERSLERMGMELFQPPSVAGWQGGEAWVDSGAIPRRAEAALALAELPHASRSVIGTPAYDVDALVPPRVRAEPLELVDALARRLLGRPWGEGAREAVARHVAALARELGADAGSKVGGRALVRSVVHLCLAGPRAALG